MIRKRRTLITIIVLLCTGGLAAGITMWIIHIEERSYALIVALRANDADKALAALNAGADPNTRDNARVETPSPRELLQHWLDSLLKRTSPTPPKNNPTALLMLFGARHDPFSDTNFVVEPIKHLPALKAMLERGADVNVQDDNGRTALDYIQSWNDSERLEGTGEQIERMLRKAGAKTGEELDSKAKL